MQSHDYNHMMLVVDENVLINVHLICKTHSSPKLKARVSHLNMNLKGKRLFIKLCHWLPKVPFFLKMANFVNLEVPYFYLK